MTEFADVVRRRRMTRSFSDRPLPNGVLDEIVALANRAPSAGKSEGWHLVALVGPQTSAFWDVTLPPMGRGRFKWQRLLDAPVILLPLADAKAYTDRYAEPDKAATGLGAGREAWPAPYWTIDASMAVMTILLAAEDAGLGALFFGVFKGERELRQALRIPPHLELLGAIALGYRYEPGDPEIRDPSGEITPVDRGRTGDTNANQGRSAGRPSRSPRQIVHYGSWGSLSDRRPGG